LEKIFTATVAALLSREQGVKEVSGSGSSVGEKEEKDVGA